LFEDNTQEIIGGIPDHYRGQAKLAFDGKNMTLYWAIGNC
jgi:hypothetical protein